VSADAGLGAPTVITIAALMIAPKACHTRIPVARTSRRARVLLKVRSRQPLDSIKRAAGFVRVQPAGLRAPYLEQVEPQLKLWNSWSAVFNILHPQP
jgi:hypothetical protein